MNFMQQCALNYIQTISQPYAVCMQSDLSMCSVLCCLCSDQLILLLIFIDKTQSHPPRSQVTTEDVFVSRMTRHLGTLSSHKDQDRLLKTWTGWM